MSSYLSPLKSLPLTFAWIGCLAISPADASTSVLDLDSLQHGEVVTNQFATTAGVTISGKDDDSSTPYPIVIFDTERTDTADPDLQRLGVQNQDPNGWDGGNLDSSYVVGNAMIVQENLGAGQTNAQGIYVDPDDRAAGGIIIMDIDANNFDYRYIQVLLVDFEETGVPFFRFTDVNGNVANYTPALEGGGVPGNNFLYITPEIDTLGLPTTDGLGAIDSDLARVEFVFQNGSGAIGFVSLSSVPEPSAGIMAVLGSLLIWRRRRVS